MTTTTVSDFSDPHKAHKAAGRSKLRPASTCGIAVCKKNPYFGWLGGKATFCVAHKEPGMVDVKNKRCEGDGCLKRGLFGFSGEKARFCSAHRLHGMVDLKNKRCKWAGCPKQANFAPQGKTTASFCSLHKSPAMTALNARRCEGDRCTKIAGFGVEGEAPIACLFHREPGMVQMKQSRVRRGTWANKAKRNPAPGGSVPAGPPSDRWETRFPGEGGGGRAPLSSRKTEAVAAGGMDDNEYSGGGGGGGGGNWSLLLPPITARSNLSDGGDFPQQPQQQQQHEEIRRLLLSSSTTDGVPSSPQGDSQRGSFSSPFRPQHLPSFAAFSSPPSISVFVSGSAGLNGLDLATDGGGGSGGGYVNGGFLGEGGGSHQGTYGNMTPDAPDGLDVPVVPDKEAAAEAWLQKLMQGVPANDAGESAWQQEHQQHQQLDMELLDTPPSAKTMRVHRQQQQQQQSWKTVLPQASEFSCGLPPRPKETTTRAVSPTDLAPVAPLEPAMPPSAPVLTKGRSSSTCSDGAFPPEAPGMPSGNFRNSYGIELGGSGGGMSTAPSGEGGAGGRGYSGLVSSNSGGVPLPPAMGQTGGAGQGGRPPHHLMACPSGRDGSGGLLYLDVKSWPSTRVVSPNSAAWAGL